MIEETGVVIETDGVMAKMLVQKRGACNGCTAKGTCESSEDGMHIEAFNPVRAKAGQRVRVSIKPQAYLKGAMFVYGLPLVAFIAGIIIGKNTGDVYFQKINSDILSVIFGFIALTISFFIVRAWSKKVETKTEYKPVIEEILNKQENG